MMKILQLFDQVINIRSLSKEDKMLLFLKKGIFLTKKEMKIKFWIL